MLQKFKPLRDIFIIIIIVIIITIIIIDSLLFIKLRKTPII